MITTHTYDGLNRVTQVSYNTVSGVTTAPTVSYVYDYDSTYGTTADGMLVRVNVGTDYQERYTFDSSFRVASAIRTIGSQTYTTSQTYNQASQVTQLTYPSNRGIDASYDSKGRLSGLVQAPWGGTLSSYLRSVTYSNIGQVTGDIVGGTQFGGGFTGGVTEVFGYDANRMQLTSQKAGTSSPYTNRMDLTYSYAASAGQMGAGSTAGNAGQLMAINNNSTINGTAEGAAYTYDNVGRLVTSDQTSNGATAQRRFSYDRWGNRTTVWDTTSGGNQLQAVTLEQSGGAPTNRIQAVAPRTNVALATNGATASASSTYSTGYAATGAINGDRKGTNWGNGGGWNDGTASSYPDWVQVNFNGTKTINELDVFTVQDNYTGPAEPSEDMTFTSWGIVDFQVQYWNGSSWQTVPSGSVTSNNKVWNRFTFSNITTDKVRVNITNALGGYSRVTEIEAYESGGAGSSYTYDSAGIVTNDGMHSYGYDSENRLVSVDGGTTASYAFDHQNQRYKKSVGSTLRTTFGKGLKP